MRVYWTQHALERQRAWEESLGITRAAAEAVLQRPEQVVEGDEGARIAQSRHGNGLLRVVYVDLTDERRVLTLYWTSRVEKYWRR